MFTIQYNFYEYVYNFDGNPHFFHLPANAIRGLFIIYIVLNLREGIYSFKNIPVWEMIRKQFMIFLEFLTLLMIILATHGGKVESGKLFEAFIFNIVSVTFTSTFNLFTYIFIRLLFFNFLKKNILILGTGKVAKEISDSIKRNKFMGYKVIGFIDPHKCLPQEDSTLYIKKNKILGVYKELDSIVNMHKIDEIIITLTNLKKYEFRMIIDDIGNKINKVTFIPKISRAYTFEVQARDFDGILAITSKTGIVKTPMAIIKRIFDIIVSLVGIFIFGLIYLIFARKIKVDGGPVIYSQERIGKDLKPFKIYKFRSMYADADRRLKELLKDKKIHEEYYRTFKLKDDPRITKVGNFLRKTSLDEFPQFINVLKGEMSIIGPRPIVQKELDNYYKTFYGEKVFAYKPGITGMWQSHGRSNVDNYDERIELDLYYTRNWSLWLDFMILVKTFLNIITKDDAY